MFASLVRNPGGRTPQTTQSDTPNLDRTMEIDSLVQSATRGLSQTALKRLVCYSMYRSTDNCPTKMLFRSFAGMALIAPLRGSHLRGYRA